MPKTKKKTSWWDLPTKWTSLLVTIISMVVAGVVGGLSEVSIGMKGNKFLYYVVVIGFAVLLVITTILVNYLEKGPTKVTTLKNSLIKAFCDALESSPFNPKMMEGESDG